MFQNLKTTAVASSCLEWTGATDAIDTLRKDLSHLSYGLDYMEQVKANIDVLDDNNAVINTYSIGTLFNSINTIEDISVWIAETCAGSVAMMPNGGHFHITVTLNNEYKLPLVYQFTDDDIHARGFSHMKDLEEFLGKSMEQERKQQRAYFLMKPCHEKDFDWGDGMMLGKSLREANITSKHRRDDNGI